MSELRKDLVSGRWVIIATERSKRPDDFRPAAGSARPEEPHQFCPFCAGSENKTPPEVYALRPDGSPPDGPGWRVRVVPNKFPALSPGAPPPKLVQGINQWMEGVGVHEVVIENPDHRLELGDLPVEHVRDILAVFQARIRAIEKEKQYQYVQVFKNKGREAGASLSHPHSQVVATPIVPKRTKEEIYGAANMFRSLQECVFCRMLNQEKEEAKRVVLDNGRFVVLTPFASRFPFEMAVYPVRHAHLFSSLGASELAELAAVLKETLSRLKATLADPPFNLMFHQAPNPALSSKAWPDMEKTYHWHIEIFPVLTKVAGFEYGTGFYINPVSPETAAEALRA
jgi:UDPglucose--hexose-1-phosphate uridylyltransferase